MRRILLLYILLSVIGLTTVHAQFDNGRQRVDENGYDQYGNQVDPDAMDAANEMNNAKAFNMIVLGGLLKLRPIVTLENVIKGLKKTLPERHHHLIPMNEEAIKKGMELIREV